MLLLLIRIGSLCYNTMEQPQDPLSRWWRAPVSSQLFEQSRWTWGRKWPANLKGNFLMLLHHMHDWVELDSLAPTVVMGSLPPCSRVFPVNATLRRRAVSSRGWNGWRIQFLIIISCSMGKVMGKSLGLFVGMVISRGVLPNLLPKWAAKHGMTLMRRDGSGLSHSIAFTRRRQRGVEMAATT